MLRGKTPHFRLTCVAQKRRCLSSLLPLPLPRFPPSFPLTFPILGTFSIRFFVGNGKPQTAKCHMTTALQSRLQFAVHVWTAGRASSGKWFTARFFASLVPRPVRAIRVTKGGLEPSAIARGLAKNGKKVPDRREKVPDNFSTKILCFLRRSRNISDSWD